MKRTASRPPSTWIAAVSDEDKNGSNSSKRTSGAERSQRRQQEADKMADFGRVGSPVQASTLGQVLQLQAIEVSQVFDHSGLNDALHPKSASTAAV
jgi:hypothetical protein